MSGPLTSVSMLRESLTVTTAHRTGGRTSPSARCDLVPSGSGSPVTRRPVSSWRESWAGLRLPARDASLREQVEGAGKHGLPSPSSVRCPLPFPPRPLSLANIRREYSLQSLTEADVDADPLKQFHTWFDQALKAEILEPTAMSLATSTADGHPSVRIVLQGPTVVLAQSDEQVMDLLRGGQGVLSMVLDIEPLQQTITEAVQLAFDTDTTGTPRAAAR